MISDNGRRSDPISEGLHFTNESEQEVIKMVPIVKLAHDAP